MFSCWVRQVLQVPFCPDFTCSAFSAGTCGFFVFLVYYFQNPFHTILALCHGYCVLLSCSRVKMPFTRGSADFSVLPQPLSSPPKNSQLPGGCCSQTPLALWEALTFLLWDLRMEKYVKGSLSKVFSPPPFKQIGDRKEISSPILCKESILKNKVTYNYLGMINAE